MVGKERVWLNAEEETMGKCADCIDQLATYYYLNRQRETPTMMRLNQIVSENASLWNELFEKIMNSLLFNKTSSDILSRPLHSILLVDINVAENYYRVIASRQPDDVVMKLKNSMITLTQNMDKTLEPILRDQFCEKCKDFKNEVLSYLVLFCVYANKQVDYAASRFLPLFRLFARIWRPSPRVGLKLVDFYLLLNDVKIHAFADVEYCSVDKFS